MEVMSYSQEATKILVESGLDFNISKRALYDGEGNRSEYYGLWNDKSGNCIHTVKESYRVSQNQEVVEMVLRGIEKYGNDLRVTKAGSINDGRKVYIQLGIEGESRVGNDIIKRNITIIDSNDGSSSLSVGIGDLTMSCSNQFWKFYTKGNKMRHSATLEQKMKQLPEMISIALSRSMKQIELYRVMAETPISNITIHQLVKDVLGYDKHFTSMNDLSEKSTRAINKMNDLYNSIHSELSTKGMNLWGLHSGITHYTTHKNSAPKRENGRMESMMLGNGYAMNEKSLEFATKFAKYQPESLEEILS